MNYLFAILSGLIIFIGAPASAQTNAVATQRYVQWKIEDRFSNAVMTVNGQVIGLHTNNVVTVSDSGSNPISIGVNEQSGSTSSNLQFSVTAASIGALTNETDAIALAALATNRVGALWGGSNFLYRVEDGTGKVWRIDNVYGWVRRDTLELSPIPYPLADYTDLNYTVSPWGENGDWEVAFTLNNVDAWVQFDVPNSAIVIDLYWEGATPEHIYFDKTLFVVTNLLSAVATTTQLTDEISVRQSADTSLSNRVNALEATAPTRSTLAPIVNPHVDMLSGDFAVTNAAGFALLATNSPASESVAYATFTQGQTIARLLYANVNGERISGSLPVNHRPARPATNPRGSLWEYSVNVYSASPTETNLIGRALSLSPDTTGSYPTNHLAVVPLTGWATNNLIVDFVCTLAYSNAYARIYSGPTNALNATASFAPLQYATLSELSPAAAAPYTTTNGVTVSWGYWTNGSPATIKSYLGTNYYESLY